MTGGGGRGSARFLALATSLPLVQLRAEGRGLRPSTTMFGGAMPAANGPLAQSESSWSNSRADAADHHPKAGTPRSCTHHLALQHPSLILIVPCRARSEVRQDESGGNYSHFRCA